MSQTKNQTARLVLASLLLIFPAPPTPGNDVLSSTPAYHLVLLTPASYRPGIPFLARVELRHPDGTRAKTVWDSVAILSTPTPNINLSTNRLIMKNGLGSGLVTVTNNGDFTLAVSLDKWQANRTLIDRANEPTTKVSGTLPGTNSTWSGIVEVVADVLVPTNHTLTIQPDTLVLINGATSNPNGKDIEVRGRVLALGSETSPISFTASANGMNWGEIRHANASPSVYQWCIFTRAGRGVGGGHTGTAPTFRTTNSKVTFANCSFTDNTFGAVTNTIGKVLEGTGSDLVMDNCLWARARMGPEINGTALLLTNSYIMDMLGPDDCDGIYLHNQNAGQQITLVDSVIAQGDDDGIDTLGSTVWVRNCIIRDWKNLKEDSKGISVYGGEVRVDHCLLVDNKCGISGKDEHSVRIVVDRSTIISTYEYALGILNKTGSMSPTNVEVRVTNSILRALNPQTHAVFTSYSPTDIHLYYSALDQTWPGAINCVTNDPRWRDELLHDYYLLPGSPCIDAGDPLDPPDPDGSPPDQGYFTFIPAPPVLREPAKLPAGGLEFLVDSYPNRNYQVEISTNAQSWWPVLTFFQTNGSYRFQDLEPTEDQQRLYRVGIKIP